MLKKWWMNLLALVLSSSSVYAAEEKFGIKTILERFGESLTYLLTKIFSPELASMEVLFQALIFIILFAFLYAVARNAPAFKEISKRITGIISLLLSFATALMIPGKAAMLVMGAYAGLAVTVMLLIPFFIVIWLTWTALGEPDYDKTWWLYTGLALLWTVYLALTTYIMANRDVFKGLALEKLAPFVIDLTALVALVAILVFILMAVFSGGHEHEEEGEEPGVISRIFGGGTIQNEAIEKSAKRVMDRFVAARGNIQDILDKNLTKKKEKENKLKDAARELYTGKSDLSNIQSWLKKTRLKTSWANRLLNLKNTMNILQNKISAYIKRKNAVTKTEVNDLIDSVDETIKDFGTLIQAIPTI